MTGTKLTIRIFRPYAVVLMLAVIVVVLAACGKSRVYREAGAGRVPPPAGKSVARPGKTVTVQRGDSLYRLAANHGVSPWDLAAWNGISAPYTIHPGQRLQLYPSGAASSANANRPETRQPSRTPPQPATPPPARSPFSWRWPTSGEVISRFSEGDPTRLGVDIGGRSGQPVHAAVGGLVVYSGAGLTGYGEVIIIKHDEQWLSVYGHNRTRRVEEGAQVKAGEQIAEMGRTGAAREMLHFEIRYNGRPVDPLRYLPAR